MKYILNNLKQTNIIILLAVIFLSSSVSMAQRERGYNEKEYFEYYSTQNHYNTKATQNPLMDNYDVKLYFLDIEVTNLATTVSGNVLIKAIVQTNDFDKFIIQLSDEHTVDSVYINDNKIDANNIIHSNNEISVSLVDSLQSGQECNAQIWYHGTPTTSGFFCGIFNTNTNGFNITHTLSEPFNAYTWWPCKQVLEDKADSTFVFLTCADSLKAGSNGLLTNITNLPNNKHRYEWKTFYPMNYYLVSFAVGNYTEYTTYVDLPSNNNMPIINYIYDDSTHINSIQSTLDGVDQMILALSKYYGEYPFSQEKYGHCSAPMGGAMEHQTMSTMGSYSNLITFHELAHQWFGNYVTCKSWSDIMINEGFATYSEYLWAVEFWPPDLAGIVSNDHSYIMSDSSGSIWIPPYQATSEYRIFSGRLSYAKGGAVIRNLQFEFQNDSLFFQNLRGFLDTYRFDVAGIDDLLNYVNNNGPKDFTQFFDQWIYGEGWPIYDVVWEWKNDTVFINTQQTTSNPVTTFFEGLMECKLYFNDGTDTTVIFKQTNNLELHYFIVDKQVTNIELDPNNWIINEVSSITVGEFENELDDKMYFNIFPNPVENNLTIDILDNTNTEISIYDCSGRLINRYSSTESRELIDVSHLEKGLYIIICEKEGKRMQKKFIKS